MINKIFKTIHNKFSTFFRFIFFLRYLFGLFLVSIILFLLIPYFFDYEKRSEIFKKYLEENYNFKISKYEKIEFKALPLPKIEYTNVLINFEQSPIELNTNKLIIYPKFYNIYNHENFQSNKIDLLNNKIILETVDLKFFIKNLFTQQNKFYFNDLNIEINDRKKLLAEIKNIKFVNFGHNKNKLEGNIFGKNFKTELNKNLTSIHLTLPNSGINFEINFDEKKIENSIKGTLKSKVLNTHFKSNFNYDKDSLSINNSLFRSKNLSFNNNSIVIFNPFFDINSNLEILHINTKIFKNLKIKRLLEFKNFLKQINVKKKINYNSKKFSRNFIDKLDLKIDLAYGRLNYLKKISISDNLFTCFGSINLLEEFPLLFFDCSINSKSKQDLLKKFNINKKKANENFNLSINGNISILNDKINLKKIIMNETYKASKEDLKYFEDKFEEIMFNESFIKIFNLKKIKRFIIEIS
tara:strand:- start:206 stop:1609 length:1404 start_codon:yes stop_codon:yes gene_type:complete